ncbi:hypothetical protein A2U01_0027278 [Trifolium medium]|uniref:Uncharacterized protein n=1 Tax=Trifolium medium TaxID=97028 RepID=A0A392P428_9FABA|nr:hypothetical protein [Trifolium medium]
MLRGDVARIKIATDKLMLIDSTMVVLSSKGPVNGGSVMVVAEGSSYGGSDTIGQGRGVSELDPNLLGNPLGYVATRVIDDLVDSLEVCEGSMQG